MPKQSFDNPAAGPKTKSVTDKREDRDKQLASRYASNLARQRGRTYIPTKPSK